MDSGIDVREAFKAAPGRTRLVRQPYTARSRAAVLQAVSDGTEKGVSREIRTTRIESTKRSKRQKIESIEGGGETGSKANVMTGAPNTKSVREPKRELKQINKGEVEDEEE